MNGQMTITDAKSKSILSCKDFLPIGSVVQLKGVDKKIMIIGILQCDINNNTDIYDYSGVLYPRGLIDPDNNYLFNKQQIQRIYYMGYHNEEQNILQEKINDYLAKKE